jgi:hypothetical protein
MPVNGRAKGRAFEQLIARDLRRQLGPKWTVERNQTDRQRGDTGTAGEFSIRRRGEGEPFRWCIECKAHKTFNEAQLWRSPVPALVQEWWAQACRQAQAVGCFPLLIVRRTRGEVLAIGKWKDMNLIGQGPTMRVQLGGESCVVYRWDDVLVFMGDE